MNDTIDEIVVRNNGRLINVCSMGHVFFVFIGSEPLCQQDRDRVTHHIWFFGSRIVTLKLQCANIIVHFTTDIDPGVLGYFKYYAQQRVTLRMFFLRAKDIGPRIQLRLPDPTEDDILDITDPRIIDGIQFTAAHVPTVRTFLLETRLLGGARKSKIDNFLISAYRVPAHRVTDILDLANLVIHDRLIVVFPHYTCHCGLDEANKIQWAIEKLRGDTRRNTNYLPTFVYQLAKYADIDASLYDFMREYPQYPTMMVYGQDGYGYSDIVIELDIDAITDTLDRDGWTPLMIDFAREQLKIDWMHSGVFMHFLVSRTDTPPEVFH